MTSPVRWWLALVAVILIVITGGVLIVRHVALSVSEQPTPAESSIAPAPAPPTASPGRSATPPALPGLRLPDAGNTTVVIQTTTAIHQFNLNSGTVVTTTTPEPTQFSSFVAGTDWVIFKTV